MVCEVAVQLVSTKAENRRARIEIGLRGMRVKIGMA
jgi:hypothetical protein